MAPGPIGMTASCSSFQLSLVVFAGLALLSCAQVPVPIRHFLFREDSLLVDENGHNLDLPGLHVNNSSPDCPPSLPGCLFIEEGAPQTAKIEINVTNLDGLSVCTWLKYASVNDYIGSHVALAMRRPGCVDWTCTYQTFSIRLDTFLSGPFPNQLYSYAFPFSDETNAPHPADHLWRTFPHNFTDKIFVPPWNVDFLNDTIPEWHHVCWTSDKTDVKVYVDGELDMFSGGPLRSASYTLDTIFGGELLEIALSPAPDGFWDGAQGLMFGDFQVFDAEIQPGQVQTLYETDYRWPADVCTPEDQGACSPFASCSAKDRVATCTCVAGYEGDGVECRNINECNVEELVEHCHPLAYCDDTDGSYECTCPAGFFGDGFYCQSNSWSVRSVFEFADVTQVDIDRLKVDYARVVTGDAKDGATNITAQSPIVETSAVRLNYVGNQITINALFPDSHLAQASLDLIDAATNWTKAVGAIRIVDGPDRYRWSGGSTSDAIQVQATGMLVESVHWEPSCTGTEDGFFFGCWVVEVTYTVSSGDINVFYLPKAEGPEDLSVDPDYTTVNPIWAQSPDDTFQPSLHPCTTLNYDPADGLPATVTACCLPQFLDMYRPISSFEDALQDLSMCTPGSAPWPRDRAMDRATVPVLSTGSLTDGAGMRELGVFVDGAFKEMTSFGEAAGVVDPFVGVYKAKFYWDEQELRTKAGKLSGTIGVEYTVDTFLGILNLSPTGTYVLDTFATQAAIHLEKTNFFTVATHGVNDYTFLEYVNLRLIAIYNEDRDFSGTDEADDRTVRTSSSAAAGYVQLTFTLGSQYAAHEEGLIPLESVRVGRGMFRDSATLNHKCVEWTDASFASIAQFNSTLKQECAPAASMCDSPASIPDGFVSFNMPLGLDFYGTPASDLSNNVFVELVISAVDTVAKGAMTAPTDGEAPWQMKTTLAASIPVVDGGINIFCDGFTAKSDLNDVASADIIVGSAATAGELSRLRILQDIGSTQLLPQEGPTRIDSDSIESGLMTLVVKGDPAYFDLAGNAATSIELEDVITIHLMEPDGTTGDDNDKAAAVMALFNANFDDNSDANGLDVDGYKLNDAFYFTVDRSALRAHLQPTEALLDLCPFSPVRPLPGNVPMTTCVTRRDVQQRNYPWRGGALSTAMEVCAAPTPGVQCADCCGALGYTAPEPDVDESRFFATVLGASDYSHRLAIEFARVVDNQYELNGRYRRAFWVNPGYEWAPTQTGGQQGFLLSQKLFLFAMIALDERIAGNTGTSITDLGYPSIGPNLDVGAGPEPTPEPVIVRRRKLLSSTLTESNGGVVGNVGIRFAVSPQSVMADVFNVTTDHIGVFAVNMQLTADEACLSSEQLQALIREKMDEYVSIAASDFLSVQIQSVRVNFGDVQCSARRRQLRLLLESYSSATADVRMMVIFPQGSSPWIDPAALVAMDGVNSIEPVSDMSSIILGDGGAAGEEGSSTASNRGKMGLIIGACAGGLGLLILAGIALFYLPSQCRRTPKDLLSPDGTALEQAETAVATKFDAEELMAEAKGGYDRSTPSKVELASPTARKVPISPRHVDSDAIKREISKDLNAELAKPPAHYMGAHALKAELAYNKDDTSLSRKQSSAGSAAGEDGPDMPPAPPRSSLLNSEGGAGVPPRRSLQEPPPRPSVDEHPGGSRSPASLEEPGVMRAEPSAAELSAIEEGDGERITRDVSLLDSEASFEVTCWGDASKSGRWLPWDLGEPEPQGRKKRGGQAEGEAKA